MTVPVRQAKLNGRHLIFIALTAATVVAWLPLIGVLASSLLAGALGCTLNEGNVHPCLVGGIDLGPVLYQAFVLGWLILVTWPLILLTLLAWIVLLALVIARRFRRPAPTRIG